MMGSEEVLAGPGSAEALAQLTSVSCKGDGNYCKNGANLLFSKWLLLIGFSLETSVSGKTLDSL